MSKSQFNQAAEQSGLYLAALMAAIAGVPMAQVQIWIRTK